MVETRITIVGCGLIGGSIALALRRRKPEWPIACLDLAGRLPALQEVGIEGRIGTLDEIPEVIPQSSIVLLATPVQSILEMLRRIGPYLQKGAIVSDVGSTKMQIMAQAHQLMPPGTFFVGGHPMAGSERSGVEAADPLLFCDRVYILCPYPDTPPEALLSLMELVESIMARPVTIDPEEHDRVMAMVSHLPQLVAIALMHAAQTEDATHTMLELLAGRGFLDMTRLAASDYAMWEGILAANHQSIMHVMSCFDRSWEILRDAVSRGDAALLWQEACRRRRKIGSEGPDRLRKPDLRSMIDQYDKQLLGILARRMQAASRIGRLKSHQAAPVHDPDRERRLLRQRSEWGKSLGLKQDFIDELFALILRQSHWIQSAGS
jgi:prephenate dehydrogenase